MDNNHAAMKACSVVNLYVCIWFAYITPVGIYTHPLCECVLRLHIYAHALPYMFRFCFIYRRICFYICMFAYISFASYSSILTDNIGLIYPAFIPNTLSPSSCLVLVLLYLMLSRLWIC